VLRSAKVADGAIAFAHGPHRSACDRVDDASIVPIAGAERPLCHERDRQHSCAADNAYMAM
jgi:hypothetical protein